jgi:hypothetical protein
LSTRKQRRRQSLNATIARQDSTSNYILQGYIITHVVLTVLLERASLKISTLSAMG